MNSKFQEISISNVSLTEKLQSNIEKHWFVLYTYPKSEKVAFAELIKREYEVFMPLTKTLKVWKNRQKKWIEQVLFPSYIFVNTRQCELHNIVRIPKIVSYIQCAGIPSTIKLDEIECIKKMLELEQELCIETNFQQGEKVKILYGPLAGYTGLLVKQKGKTRFGIQLKEINHTVFIDICITALKKL